MATIGQQLTTPESGWRRYDDTDSRISYVNCIASTYSGMYSNTYHATIDVSSRIQFKFTGSKLRLITVMSFDKSTRAVITIDGVSTEFSMYAASAKLQMLVFEKTDLIEGIHSVEISTPNDGSISLDAIDIDVNGYLVHPTLTQRSTVSTMDIGDCIPCRYTAGTSGAVGTFSELGTCIADEIPVTGSATPNGLFYFIKVDTGKLIADRNVQHTITWDNLNSGGYIESSKIISEKNIEFNLTSNTGALGSVISSGVWTTGYEGWRAFDTNESDFYKAGSSSVGVHLGFNFNTPRVISSIVVKSGNFGGIKAQYSENGTTWIDFAVNVSGTLATGMKFILDNQPHKYFRVYMTSTSGGYPYINQIQFYEYDDPNFAGKISAISGGVSYRDSFNLPSTTNLKLGGWPIDNEWDTYIVNSDLNGKIVKGDDNIWHWSTIQSWCKETPFAGIKDLTGTSTASNIHRIGRGVKDSYGNVERFSIAPSNNNSATWGFRPVLEYKEASSKATNLYY